MIIEILREQYAERAKKESGRGNPTGSKLGACTAALQQMMWRDYTNPAPWQPRSVMTVEVGRLLGEWMSGAVGRAFPGLWGLNEQPFYLPIPYPEDAKAAEVEATFKARVEERLSDNSRRLWGTLLGPKDRFVPPSVEVLKGGQLKTTGISLGAPKKDWRGLILEPRRRTLWTPVFVDGILNHPEYGLTVVEDKTMSTPAFRRALLGRMDYGYRCQLLAATRATGFDAAVWLCLRKETAHWAEITFLKKHAAVRVDLIRTSGVRESYIVVDAGRNQIAPADAPSAISEKLMKLDQTMDGLWDAALVWTPFDEGAVLEQMYRRAWRVILSTVEDLQRWDREYGPDFSCPTCDGTGTQTKAKTGGHPLKAGPKPCSDCGATGQLDEVELPWQCSYCDVVNHCYGPAGVRLEVDSRPHYRIRRDAWLASGLTFIPPERAEPVVEEEG